MAPKSKKTNLEEVDQKKVKSAGIPRESNRFAIADDFYKTLVRLEVQKLYLRWSICLVAFIMIIALSCLEYKVLQYIGASSDNAGDLIFTSRDLIFLAVSPIFAITAIIISVLISVFRVNVDDAGKAAQIIGGTSSGLG